MNIIFASRDETACGYQRAQLPAAFLSKYYDVALFDGTDPASIKITNETVIILQRTVGEEYLRFILHARSTLPGLKIIMDLDDNLWEIPAHNPASAAFNTQQIKTLNRILALCDAVTVSTLPLWEYVRRFHGNVHQIPNYVDNDPVYPSERDKPLIGWAGSPTHSDDFCIKMLNALLRLKTEGLADLCFYGYCPPMLRSHAQVVPFGPLAEYRETIKRLNFTIGLIPCADTVFNASKSNLKYLEYAMLGVPAVASDVSTYNGTITHGINGLLVRHPKEWHTALLMLCLARQPREALRESARRFVQRHYTYDHAGHIALTLWRGVFQSIGKQP